MSYSIWLDGMEIGETSLELSPGGTRRAGVFRPTASGLEVLPGITAMAPALLDAGRLHRENGMDDAELEAEDAADSFFDSPEGQRVMNAAKLVARIEIHGPGGEIVPWESLLISDMKEFVGLAGGPVGKFGMRFRRMPVPERARYFISAQLVVPGSVGAYTAGSQRMS